MRKSLIVAAATAMLMVLVLIPISVSAAPPTTGTQISVFDGIDVSIPAGEPFYVRHGWAQEFRPPSTLHSYGFDLFVDGKQQHGPRDIVIEDGVWVDQYWIFNFRKGLPAGSYTFYGEWTGPNGIVLVRQILVTAFD